jgi:hypothetical protein
VHARTLKTIAAIAAFLLTSFGARATSVLPLDLNQIIAGAERVVHVRCTANEVQPDPNVGTVTVTTFAVLDRAKGVVGSTLTVRQPGGELNGLAIDFHVPKFSVGSEYILFMPASSKLGFASPVGLSQGVFSIVQGSLGKEVGNGRDFAELLPGADAATVPAGVAARLKLAPAQRSRMDLDDFMTLLRTKVGPQ